MQATCARCVSVALPAYLPFPPTVAEYFVRFVCVGRHPAVGCRLGGTGGWVRSEETEGERERDME